MAIPDPSKAGSPFSPLQTDGWNPKTPEINNFFIPEIALRGGYALVAVALVSGIVASAMILRSTLFLLCVVFWFHGSMSFRGMGQ